MCFHIFKESAGRRLQISLISIPFPSHFFRQYISRCCAPRFLSHARKRTMSCVIQSSRFSGAGDIYDGKKFLVINEGRPGSESGTGFREMSRYVRWRIPVKCGQGSPARDVKKEGCTARDTLFFCRHTGFPKKQNGSRNDIRRATIMAGTRNRANNPRQPRISRYTFVSNTVIEDLW
jgi:hypothetical protein